MNWIKLNNQVIIKDNEGKYQLDKDKEALNSYLDEYISPKIKKFNNLEEKIVIQNKINKLRELESLLKQSPKNCTLEKVRNLFRENYQIAKDLALIVKDDSLVASIFHPTTTQDPTLLLNSNGKNWIQELTKTYEEQQKHTSFTHEKKDLNAINARQPFKAWQYRNRREQLLAFSAQLKKQPELELSTLRQSYRDE